MPANENPDVTIIGAGIVGICCALSLLEKGKSVRLIDRGEPGQGTSYGNAGVISPWSCVPLSLPGLWKEVPFWLLDPDGPVSVRPGYLPKVIPWTLRFFREGRSRRVREISKSMAELQRPNVDLYKRHLAGTGHEDLLQDCWYLHVYRDGRKARLDDLAWQLHAEQGAPIERIDGDALREIEPCLSPEYQAAIVMKGQARALAPGRLGKVLAEKARRMGATIVRATVSRLLPEKL